MRAGIAAAAVALAAGAAAGGAAEWKIPSPLAAEHPGSKEAPASDPRTYPFEREFQARRDMILKALACADLGTWRKGYFRGGDPGKYLPCHAMAKLMLGTDLENVRQFMNDDRGPAEHYHFATVNLARFYAVFGSVFTDESRKRFADSGVAYGSYMSPVGTENHKVMWMTSANVLPHLTDAGLSRVSKETALARARDMLMQYVKGLYAAGQGEWDSSTYLMFDLNGMLNIYDFSPDAECRLLAKAALDWYAAAYALKYTDGVYTAPNQRGFAAGPAESIADQTGWLWWGGNAAFTTNDAAGWRWTMHAATSAWRPNRVLCNLATKRLAALPFEQRNTKPNYWFGLKQEPRPGVFQETVYANGRHTMGALWRGHGSQVTRFQVVVSTAKGGVAFTGGHPRRSDHTLKRTDIGFQDGNGRYSQFAQAGAAAIHIAVAPDEETEALYSFFSVPEGIESERMGDWHVMRAGESAVCVRPLGGQAQLAEGTPDRNGRKPRYLRIDGRKSGFVVQLLDAPPGTPDAVAAQIVKASVIDARFASDLEVTYTAPDNRRMRMKFVPASDGMPGEKMAEVEVDGTPVTFAPDEVYDGPYVRQKGGVLTVNDGREGFVVDFSGDLPRYRPWTRP